MEPTEQQVDDEIRERKGAPGTHAEFDRLVRTIWRLRRPEDGCPWDRVQTHESIAKDLIGEGYEAVEAIHNKDLANLCEELGDVLEQVLLQSQIAADDGEFDIDDVLAGLNQKLIRRHPHIFGDLEAVNSDGEAMDIWDDVKRAEREAKGEDGQEPGLLDSVPRSLPALAQCEKISRRAAKTGFEWDTTQDVWEQVASERAEYEAEEPGSQERAEEFGDLLFALVNVARREHIDAEEALAASNRKFRRRWAAMESYACEEGRDIDSYTTAELNQMWSRAKAEERA